MRRLYIALFLLVCSGVFGEGRGAESYSRKDAMANAHITENVVTGAGYEIVPGTGKQFQSFQKIVVTGSEFDSLISRAALQTGLDSTLIRALIKVESNFNPRALSPKGAKGLMQLMPALARYYGVKEPFDPVANIMAGSSYLKALQDRFVTLDKTLAAYKTSPSQVEELGDAPPFAETQKYITRVKWYYQNYYKSLNLVNLKGVHEAFDQACSAFEKGDFRRSAYLFGLVLNKYPASSETNYNLALVEEKRGKLTESVNLYRQALRYDPYCMEACYNLAILYERLSLLDETLLTLKSCLQCELSPVSQRQIRFYMQELRQLQKKTQ